MKGTCTMLARMFALFFLFVSLVAPVSVCLAQGTEMVGPKIILKLSHQWPQDLDDFVIQTGVRFAEEVKKRSGGAINIVFYPAQSLIKAKDQFRAMRQGIIDMSIYPIIYAAGEMPELNITLVPWANTHESFYKFGKSKVWDYLEGKMNKMGVKSVCWIQFAGGIASRGDLVRKPSDVEGIKVRAAGKYCQRNFRYADAGIVTMPSSEAYTAMQRGLLDAMQTSSASFGAYKLYEVSKSYLSPIDFSSYRSCEPIFISMRAWKKLTPEQQKIMLDVGRELEPFALEGAKHEDVRVAKMFEDHGCTVEKMTAKDWAAWRALMDKAIEDFKKEVPNGEWLVEETLKLYQ